MKKMLYALIIFPLFLTSCAELFQGKVAMSGLSNGTLSGLLSDKEKITELSAPAQVFVSQSKSPSTIDITWQSVTGAVSYRLERAVVSPAPDGSYAQPDESLFNVLEQAVYGTSYTDTILRNVSASAEEYANRYYYRISAENTREKYEPSPFTEPEYGTLFAPPSNVRADLGESTDKVTVYWNKTAGAASYDVYRATNSSGAGAVRIANVTGDRNQYINKIDSSEQGTEFYYLIYANNSHGIQSAHSSIALGYALVAGAPGQPKNVTVTNGRGTSTDSIAVSWDTVAGIGVTYSVYRTSSVDTSFTLLKSGATATTYTDSKSLKPGIYYYYQIQAATTDAETQKVLKSKFSASGASDAVPAEGFVLSPPDTLSAIKEVKNNNEINILKWTPAIGSAAEQGSYTYEIYGDSSAEGTFSNLLESAAANTLTVEDGYLSVTLSQNSSYYKIKTKNGSVTSTFSSITAPAPFAAENITATQRQNLDGAYMTANSSGVYPVKITWNKPSNDTPAGYHVYRSTKETSGYRKITDSPITDTFFIDADETSKAGKQYYYRVLSLNALGQGTNYTDTAIGYGALTYEQYMREYNKTVKASQKKLTLMHKSSDMDKLGSESVYGLLGGSLSYNAKVAGLGARITMHYENYADFYTDNDAAKGIYFTLTGDTNTSASMDASGSMDGTVVCSGMYPGKVYYDKIQIKGGAAGGGSYGIEPDGFARQEVSWLIGEE
ncbi:Fibronectin type III domain protein [Treponema brennaborense DSM 12168]|uniref:Fibronectin type III domain protein n=2 Tax=Treponema TaxID=157 RepID=F4LN69_TREBD|nr:Fibronectin type III domain protein [Treponema brennaborense DSM 12168]